AIRRAKVSNTTVKGFIGLDGGWFYRCEATGCSGTAAFDNPNNDSNFFDCYAHDNTCTGFKTFNGALVRCIADTNTGAS
ncbi:hypothetical protein, partial [Klebsiella pneumoniae]|uniref:hypothetical protein n=1 Tax=Klebsiella pneumoniae TaxID=573 RepID=UPI00404522AF